MSRKNLRRVPLVLPLGIAAILFSGVKAWPQTAADQSGARIGVLSGSPSSLKAGPQAELMSVFTPRSQDEIQRRLEFARTNQEYAERDIALSHRLVQDAEGRVKISSEELGTTRTRLSVAKKANNAADRQTLELALKRQEAEKKYLASLLDVVKADADWLDSRKSAAEARVKALEIEKDTTKKYAELSSVASNKTADTSGYQGLLRQLLDAQRKAADHAEDAASKEKEAAARRVKQLDTLAKLKP